MAASGKGRTQALSLVDRETHLSISFSRSSSSFCRAMTDSMIRRSSSVRWLKSGCGGGPVATGGPGFGAVVIGRPGSTDARAPFGPPKSGNENRLVAVGRTPPLLHWDAAEPASRATAGRGRRHIAHSPPASRCHLGLTRCSHAAHAHTRASKGPHHTERRFLSFFFFSLPTSTGVANPRSREGSSVVREDVDAERGVKSRAKNAPAPKNTAESRAASGLGSLA